MSDPANPPPKEVEVDLQTLRKLLDDEENRAVVRSRVNRFDRSMYSARLRDTTREVYQRRGENEQQRETMQGFMKARGRVPELGYNLSLGMANELGGFWEAAKGLRNKSWLDKNGGALLILVVGAVFYFGYLYSPTFQETVNAFFEPLGTRIFIGATIIVIIYLIWRQRRNARPT